MIHNFSKTLVISQPPAATATVQVSSHPQLLGATTYYEMGDSSSHHGYNGANGGSILADDLAADDSGGEDSTDGRFWHTSVGRFKNNLDSLPQTLQYIYQLLTELPTINKPDILYYILQCLHTLTLHGDVLTLAANQHRGFFLWCQENLLIQK